jgi:hypothetical protein
MAFLHSIRRLLTVLLVAALLAVLAFVYLVPRINPADLPWTALDLEAPVGRATAGKLARLEGGKCLSSLADAAISVRAVPAVSAGACGYDDGVRWSAGGVRGIGYAPAAPVLACPLAASLAVWEREVVQPAALQIMGSRVRSIDHFGSYACRRLYGRSSGGWSEHAHARALDVAGFRFEDGRRLTVASDWSGQDAEARFLHAVRDGACDLFSTTLSPDYNAAHRDHLHLDMARRGGMWRACR